jgi:hypothetical protein
MTATEWLTIMGIDATDLLLCLIGEALYRAFRRALDADTLRRIQAKTAHHDFLYGGSAGSVGVETPPPASGCPSPLHPGAGPQLQAGDSRLDGPRSSGRYGGRPTTHDRGGATELSVEPAPGTFRPGAGPHPRTAALSALPSRGEAVPPDSSGGPARDSRSESAPPDPAPIGVAPHPRGEGVGAASPRLVAPIIGSAA